jgi:coproporphyrinogen III oxidase
MISVVAHELEEAITDPNLNAYYDSSGNENADKCAWTFGQAQTLLPSGAYYNMTVAGLHFLVQRNLDRSDSKCYVSYKGQQ